MNKTIALLVCCFSCVLGASAAELDPREIVAQAKAAVAAEDLAAFVKNLGDGVYSGSGGSLTAEGSEWSIVETRAIVAQKTLHGNPGATLRITRRAALKSNPEHVETFAGELSLEARGSELVVERDGVGDATARLDKATEHALVFSYRKSWGRYRPETIERLSLSLDGGRLCVERVEASVGVEKARESFCAER